MSCFLPQIYFIALPKVWATFELGTPPSSQSEFFTFSRRHPLSHKRPLPHTQTPTPIFPSSPPCVISPPGALAPSLPASFGSSLFSVLLSCQSVVKSCHFFCSLSPEQLLPSPPLLPRVSRSYDSGLQQQRATPRAGVSKSSPTQVHSVHFCQVNPHQLLVHRPVCSMYEGQVGAILSPDGGGP